MITKLDFEVIDNRLKAITEQEVTVVENQSEFPPTLDELEDNNKTYSIMAAILFIDIRKSTYLTENSQAKSMVKIYRSFMRMAVDCVRKNDGVTRQFLGDRIMGVFMDGTDESGAIKNKAVDKAVNAARTMQTLTDFSLNKHLKEHVNGKCIECGIGIDYGKILVTKAGMYGVEQDTNKENEVSFVWVGNATNHASKYSDLTNGGEIFVSEAVYSALSDSLKVQNWNKVIKAKNSKTYQGYSISNFYLDFSGELGTAVSHENISSGSEKQLADMVKEVNNMSEKISAKEKQLAVQEERIKKKESSVKESIEKIYYKVQSVIQETSSSQEKVGLFGAEWWIYIIEQLYSLGEELGESKDDIKERNDYYLMCIYDNLGMYKESFDMMVFMAEHSSMVFLKKDTLEWGKREKRLFDLKFEIEYRMKHDSSISIEEFQKALDEVKLYE